MFARIFILACLALAMPAAVSAQAYLPPGYGAGASVEGTGFDMGVGYTEIDDDIYVTLTPIIELPFFFDIKLGLQIPLEVLVYDREPKDETKKVPSLRTGTFDDTSDYLSLIKYARRGTHLYYNPGDSFNWSFFYGQMNDGYIGHKTIVYRYVSNYDPTVWKPGLMADINNDWGGVEAFASDVYRKEAVAGRGYIRPVGIVTSVHDIFFAHAGFQPVQVALSRRENRDPRLNGGVFFQEDQDKHVIEGGRGGRLEQHLYPSLRESLEAKERASQNRPVEFVRTVDPVTGEEQVRAVPVDSTPGPGPGPATPGQTPPPAIAPENPEDSKGSKWSPSFWNRWAVGYTIARDKDAPLTLQYDGSSNLIVDPDTKRPRASTEGELTIVGMDTEFRLSPFDILDVTPYVDINRIKELEGDPKGLHAGVNFELKFSTIKFYFRPEYREMSSNYLPTYFDQYYSIERTALQPRGISDFSGLSTASGQTKLAYLQSLEANGSKVRGWFGQALMDWLQLLVLEATFEDYVGVNNSRIFVGFYVPNVVGLFLNGYYTKQGFNHYKESFEFDDRSLAVAELGYTIIGGLYVKASFRRTWIYDTSTSAYTASDEITYSTGFSSSF